MLKVISVTLLSFFLSASSAFAAAYDGFRDVTVSSLKPFTRDIGGLLGSGTNQTARPLGFSGFDLGVRGMAQFTPSGGNTVLKKNDIFGLGVVQAEIGMPYRVDGFVRGGSSEGMTVAGGGLRYGLWNVTDEKYKVNAMIVGMANIATNRYFYAVHFNTSVLFSINLPGVSPYLGAGCDFTRLEAQGVVDPALVNKDVRVNEPRFTAGLRARYHLAYIAGGYTYTHGRGLVNASAGFRF